MAVDLQWHDACHATRAFTSAENAAGWPDAMTLAQLAAIQRPYERGDKAGLAAQRALHAALQAACTAGELEHTTETKEVRPPKVMRVVSTRMEEMPASGFWAARGFTRQW